MLTTESRSGSSVTAPTGAQSRVCRGRRTGLRSRAVAHSDGRGLERGTVVAVQHRLGAKGRDALSQYRAARQMRGRTPQRRSHALPSRQSCGCTSQ